MRFDNSFPATEVGLLAMNTHHHTGDLDSPLKPHHNREKRRYIHRCPFTHCPHQEILNSPVEADPRGITVPIEALRTTTAATPPSIPTSLQHNWPPEFRRGKTEDLGRGGGGSFIQRGGVGAHPKITTQYRQRAILYMLNRMKVKRNYNEIIYRRLIASILTLEKQVYEASESKEKYTENLATKLFLICQELERRKNMSGKSTIYKNFTLGQKSVVDE